MAGGSLLLGLGSGCGRFGFDNIAGRKGDGIGNGKDTSGLPDAEAPPTDRPPGRDAGAQAVRDAATGSDAAATPLDSGRTLPDADPGDSPDACGACSAGMSCIAGRCVEECSGTFASSLSCNGFENGLSNLGTNAGVSTASAPVHTGTTSLRTESSGSGVTSRAVFPIAPTQATGDLYFRAYYYIETPPTDGLIKLAGFESSADNDVDINLFPDRSFDFYFHEMGGARVRGGPNHAQFDTWLCIQVALTLSNTTGSVALRVNDMPELSSPADRDTRTASGVDRATVGIAWSETASTTVVYVDDVVIDTVPVPCQ